MVRQLFKRFSIALGMMVVSMSTMAQPTSGDKDYGQLLEKLIQEDVDQAMALADSLVNTPVLKDTAFCDVMYQTLFSAVRAIDEQERSIELAYKMMDHYTYESDPLRNLWLNSQISVSLRRLNQRDSSRNLIKHCLEKTKVMSGKRTDELKLFLLQNLGIAYGMDSNVKPSMKAFLQADSLALKLNKENIHAYILEYLGNLYAQMRQFEEAAEKFATSRAFFLKKEMWGNALASTDNLARMYSLMGKYEESIQLLNEARGYAIQLNDKKKLAMNYLITADAYSDWEKYQDAQPYFKKAIYMFDSLKLPHQQVQGMNSYAKALLSLGEFQKSVDISLEQQKIAESIGIRRNVMSAYFNLWHALDSLGNQDEAYKCVQKYWWLKDSITRSNFNSEVAGLQNNLESKLKEAQIEKLELESKLATANAERSETFNKWLMIGGALVLVAALILLFLLRNIRKARNEIATQNQQLQKSDHEKAVLLKELHHRVKNNLQIVSSLLNMQGESVKDEKALEAFKEGQNRVDAMAMIHKHLYSTDELTSVEISGYLERLVMSLAFSYGYNKSNFQLESQITEQPIDVDVAIPIGLIVNELASNAFKHAFTKEGKCRMKLELKVEDDQLTLLLEDNGKGLPDDFSLDGLQSFGLELVHTLVNQLKGQVSFQNQDGAHFFITLHPSKAMAA